jgi:hypothetical protein
MLYSSEPKALLDPQNKTLHFVSDFCRFLLPLQRVPLVLLTTLNCGQLTLLFLGFINLELLPDCCLISRFPIRMISAATFLKAHTSLKLTPLRF